MSQNKNYLLSILEASFYFLPLSFVIGSLILNINIIFFLTVGSIYFFIKKIKIKLNYINITLLLYFLILILSSLINFEVIGGVNLVKSIFLLRFFLLYIFIETLFYDQKLKLKYFFNICLILVLFLSLDLILQFLNGANIFGYEPWEGRITGVFHSEAIAGAYIQKTFIFSIISIISLVYSSIKKKSLFITASFIVIIFASFIASNRISFLILFITVLFLIFFYKILRKKLIISLLVLLPIFYHFYQIDNQVNSRYKGFINKISQLKEFTKSNTISKNDITKDNINIEKEIKINSLPNHGKIFLTAYMSFQENIFLGNGMKSFRYKCKKFLDQKIHCVLRILIITI